MSDVGLVLIVTLSLYVFIPGYLLFFRGWPLRAGFGMLLVAQFPLLWQIVFTDSEAMGFGILLLVMLPLPLLLIAIGAIAGAVRLTHLHRLREPEQTRS